jgi:Fe-S oxidoreductase
MFLSKEERDETIRACRFCPMCHIADRSAQLVRRESYTPRGRAAVLAAIEAGFLEWDKTAVDIMYTALNDGLLQEWCVGNYDYEELIVDARSRIFELGLAPEEVAKYAERLRANKGRGINPEEILAKEEVKTDPKGDVLLFCGCETLQSNPATVVAMGRLFNQAGAAFQILPEEPCCGWSLYQLGDFEGARSFSIRLAEEIKASGASRVAVLDADCFRMLSTRNARFGGDLKGIGIIPAMELLAEWIDSGRITITGKITEPLTYHDPCVLARYCEDTDTPRKIIASVLDGELREMDANKKMANCCGAGGMLAVHRPDLSRDVALLRLEEARSTGASTLVTGCPRCDSTFTRAMEAMDQEDIQLTNLVKLTARAAGLGE